MLYILPSLNLELLFDKYYQANKYRGRMGLEWMLLERFKSKSSWCS